jgi:hypothetical protein
MWGSESAEIGGLESAMVAARWAKKNEKKS